MHFFEIQTGPNRSRPVQTGPDVGPVWTGLDRFGICPKNDEINKNMFLHFIKTYFKVVPHVFLDLCFFFFSSQLSANVWTYPFKKAPPLVPNRNITRGGFLIIWGFLKFNYIPQNFRAYGAIYG